MQIKLFTVPIGDNGEAVDEMNRFLRGNKILQVDSQLVNLDRDAFWTFCIRYIEKGAQTAGADRVKVDYRYVLDEATFAKFSKLRELRKKVAAEEGLPAYAVFTDEELAGLAKLDVISRKTMLSVKGIGDKKVERFGKYFIQKTEKDETTGTPDRENS
ncbi:HRDC domain-containing protein [candidate division KSB1 bacterium]|nr:HRDC domain-containing protein [candidate division KSB1 bacterium]